VPETSLWTTSKGKRGSLVEAITTTGQRIWPEHRNPIFVEKRLARKKSGYVVSASGSRWYCSAAQSVRKMRSSCR
jgi:hypothetical protein